MNSRIYRILFLLNLVYSEPFLSAKVGKFRGLLSKNEFFWHERKPTHYKIKMIITLLFEKE